MLAIVEGVSGTRVLSDDVQRYEEDGGDLRRGRDGVGFRSEKDGKGLCREEDGEGFRSEEDE